MVGSSTSLLGGTSEHPQRGRARADRREVSQPRTPPSVSLVSITTARAMSVTNPQSSARRHQRADHRQAGQHADDGQGDRQSSRCFIHAENFVASNDQPVEQRRFLQARYAVVRWKQPVMARHHLARGSGVLALRLAVEIAGTNGHHM